MTLIDIETTVLNSCWKVTHDRSVPDHVVLARKRGLLILGQIFSSKCPLQSIDEVLRQVMDTMQQKGG